MSPADPAWVTVHTLTVCRRSGKALICAVSECPPGWLLAIAPGSKGGFFHGPMLNTATTIQLMFDTEADARRVAEERCATFLRGVDP